MRLVFPGPSYALAQVTVRQNDLGQWTLHAAKDFAFGERVYEFWRSDWPFGGRDSVVVVASTKLDKFDLPEGTVINLDPKECAAKKDRSGHFQFSGFDLLVSHSCLPNLTYNDLHEDEDDEWQCAYATRDIKSGEALTIDFNSVFWDRSGSSGANDCHCGTSKCVGTKAGFKLLPKEAQEERKLMTWRRVLPPYQGEKEADTKYLGMALTPHVRESWRADSELGCDCPETAPSSSSSSESSDDSEASDDESSSDSASE
uniref:SET domain-containing protein n=1 Tax=Minutocellus polymorphus TaxID=265543 RepID=A0A7S0FM98_9STRA